jgi:hypothetical protein
MSFQGFVAAAAQLGLTSLLIKPERGIKSPLLPDGKTYLQDIVAQAVIEERHTDQMEITEHPVEVGASISDHAFKLPAEVVIRMAWSNSPSDQNSLVNAAVGAVSAASSGARAVAGVASFAGGIQSAISGYGSDQLQNIYNNLLVLQESRALFHLYTGKRRYSDMICRSIAAETDASMENTLIITMECQQLILVNTQVVKIGKNAAENSVQTPTQVGTVKVVSQ